jgi:hypothetical protein
MHDITMEKSCLVVVPAITANQNNRNEKQKKFIHGKWYYDEIPINDLPGRIYPVYGRK